MNDHPTTVENVAQKAGTPPINPSVAVANGEASQAQVAAAVLIAGRTPGLKIDAAALDALLDRIASYPELDQFHQDIRDARKAADEAGSDHPL